MVMSARTLSARRGICKNKSGTLFIETQCRMIGLPHTEESMMIRYVKPFRYNTVPQRDGRTDGQTEFLYQNRASALCWRALKTAPVVSSLSQYTFSLFLVTPTITSLVTLSIYHITPARTFLLAHYTLLYTPTVDQLDLSLRRIPIFAPGHIPPGRFPLPSCTISTPFYTA